MANTSMKRVILDSGESIFVLSGKVKNESSRTYKQMYLEAIAFDQAGKPMSFTKVDAGSTLAKTRIKALTPEMIHNLQSASGAKEWSLKPGAESEFAIAMGEVLSGDDFSAARYFSARIHSVKY